MIKNAERIKELQDKICELNSELNKLKRENCGYFIGKTVDGNGDYWDEYYIPLGKIEECVAEFWCKDQLENGGSYESDYFEVTPEIYNKYLEAARMCGTLKDLNCSYYKKLKNYNDFRCSLDDRIDFLYDELGLEYRSFQHILPQAIISMKVREGALK